jgi:hypothetical protein
MPTTDVTILERIIASEHAELSPEVARYLLTLDFPQDDRRQMELLHVTAEERVLTALEQTDLDHYRRVARLLDCLRMRARQFLAAHHPSDEAGPPDRSFAIPAGIRCSQEALRRDLPRLLASRQLRGQWIAYHGDERIGIAPDARALLGECVRRGFRDDEYYLGWIDPTELIEEEELEPPSPGEIEEDETTAPA